MFTSILICASLLLQAACTVLPSVEDVAVVSLTGDVFRCDNIPMTCTCDTQEYFVSCEQLTVGNTSQDIFEVLHANTKSLEILDSEIAFNLSSHSVPLHHQLLNITLVDCYVVDVFTLPPSIFTSCHYLDIIGTNVSALASNSLEALTELVTLNLCNDSIGSISTDAFRNQIQLEHLDLSYNNLETLSNGAFRGLLSLLTLNLSHNQISRVLEDTFRDLQSLQAVHLEFNNLHTLDERLFLALPNLQSVNIVANPLDCNCGLIWLSEYLNDESSPVGLFQDEDSLVCRTPAHLQGYQLLTLSKDNFTCDSPSIVSAWYEDALDVNRANDVLLECNATGLPNPSVYWKTPHGLYLARPDARHWISPAIHSIQDSHEFSGKPTYEKAKLSVNEAGALFIDDIRYFYSGEYTCVAENPGGVVNASVTVHIKSPVINVAHIGILFGLATATVILMLGSTFAGIRMIIENNSKTKKKLKELKTGREIEDLEENNSPRFERRYYYDDYFDDNMYYLDDDYYSPKHCMTPAEGLDAEQEEYQAGISMVLEDVRESLNYLFGSIRSSAHASTRYINRGRQSSSRYMQKISEHGRYHLSSLRATGRTLRESGISHVQTIRSTSGQYISTLRESSSQYAVRVKSGVAMGVESVKYHVQSMKEFCGTGEMSHTISTISVQTNVDNNQDCQQVVKSVTYL